MFFSLAPVPENIAADRPQNDEISNILQKYKNYRFGAVNVYEILNVEEVKEYRKSKSAPDAVDAEESASCLEELSDEVNQLVQNGVEEELDIDEIIENIIDDGLSIPPRSTLQCAFDYYVSQLMGGGAELITRAYLITTRPKEIGGRPDQIIGLIVSEKEFEEATSALKDNLETPSTENIYPYSFLIDEDIDESKYGFGKLYDMLYNNFIQGNVSDKTMEARGLGTDITFFNKSAGNTFSLINGLVTSREVQTFKRISEGAPINYHENTNELLVSPDMVRWVSYDKRYLRDRQGRIRTDTLGNMLLDYRRAANDYLPKFGLEMKYGIDELNYPSFWSERMTVSALWDNVKLGVILPTNGWSSFADDVFEQERKFTHAGIGIAGKIDFPFAVIPESGVFQVGFGYLFGDAVESTMLADGRSNDPDIFVVNTNINDHLIRSHAQLHYTFGVSIDEDYLLRFGLGGTIYSVEQWYNDLEEDEFRNKSIVYKKIDNETVGGISGKFEFMVINNTTPYGFSLQYFDESISSSIWLQIPVIEDRLLLKLDASGYFVAFKDDPRPWELESIFTPMARVIVLF